MQKIKEVLVKKPVIKPVKKEVSVPIKRVLEEYETVIYVVAGLMITAVLIWLVVK